MLGHVICHTLKWYARTLQRLIMQIEFWNSMSAWVVGWSWEICEERWGVHVSFHILETVAKDIVLQRFIQVKFGTQSRVGSLDVLGNFVKKGGCSCNLSHFEMVAIRDYSFINFKFEFFWKTTCKILLLNLPCKTVSNS